MKTIFPLLAAGLCFASPALGWGAVSNPGVYAVSPDHPSTWVSGADNVHQDLRWSDAKKMLVADVRYSTIEYADDTHPTETSEYTLAFPNIQFNAQSHQFLAGKTVIGTLHYGFFGANIVLDRGIELSIHRHHGRIFAAIIPADEE